MKLGETGKIEIRESAVNEYALAKKLSFGAARTELAALLAEAHRVEGDTENPERWRFRKVSLGIDINARVVRDGETMRVVAITVRNRDRRTGRRK